MNSARVYALPSVTSTRRSTASPAGRLAGAAASTAPYVTGVAPSSNPESEQPMTAAPRYVSKTRPTKTPFRCAPLRFQSTVDGFGPTPALERRLAMSPEDASTRQRLKSLSRRILNRLSLVDSASPYMKVRVSWKLRSTA